jgi:hypothetical protein
MILCRARTSSTQTIERRCCVCVCACVGEAKGPARCDAGTPLAERRLSHTMSDEIRPRRSLADINLALWTGHELSFRTWELFFNWLLLFPNAIESAIYGAALSQMPKTRMRNAHMREKELCCVFWHCGVRAASAWLKKFSHRWANNLGLCIGLKSWWIFLIQILLVISMKHNFRLNSANHQ